MHMCCMMAAQPRVLAQISFYDLGQTHTRELSSRVVIGGSGVVPLCMCVYATPGDEGSERIIYGDSQVRHACLQLGLREA